MELSAEKLRQLFLVRVLFICTIGFFGTSVILLGPFRSTSEQTLQSLLAIGLGVIASVAVTMPMLTNRWRTQGHVAYTLILIAVAITLVFIWIPWFFWSAREYYHPRGVVVGAWALSGYFVLSALTSLARLRRQWMWVRRATLIVAALLTIQLASLAIWLYGLPDA